MKVLIADDNPMFRLLLEKHVRGWGYEVVTAEDGDKAWGILTGEHAAARRPARLADARHGRRRDLPPAQEEPQPAVRLHHHADRPRHQGGHGDRPGERRRRLPGQAGGRQDPAQPAGGGQPDRRGGPAAGMVAAQGARATRSCASWAREPPAPSGGPSRPPRGARSP